MAVRFLEKDLMLLYNIGQIQRYRAQENIYTQGDDASSMYVVIEGRVRVFYLSMEGKERTIEILEKGRIFGDSSFLTNSRRSVTIQAVVDTKIIRCNAEELLEICFNNRHLLRTVFQHMTETCDYLTHQIIRSNFYTSEQKVADFLLKESDSRKSMCLPYTHEEIAESVGMNRVTVSRILSKLSKEGMIDLQYRKVIITDKVKMSKL